MGGGRATLCGLRESDTGGERVTLHRWREGDTLWVEVGKKLVLGLLHGGDTL